MTKLIQTTRELVLLHLKDLKIDEEEVTFGATLNGISKSIGSDRQEVKKVLEELLQENLIKKSVSKVRGRMRERNVYSLTKKGKKKERKIRKKIEDRTIKVKTGQTTDIFKIKDIGEFFEREDPLIKIIQNIDDDTLDLNQDEEQKNVFVGRDKELSKLRELLEMVKKEGSKTIFIAGEAGVGKTRLISELKPYALEEGYDFLTGTCHSEIADPYLPLKEAFDKYINGEEEHSSQYRNIAFLGARKGKKIENKKMFDAERQATFYETTQTIKNIGKKDPLVVFLDDMHWTDKASADILSYITNKIDKEPILFICAYRPEDLSANHPLKDNILHMISHTPDALKIELNPLNLESTGKIIKGVLGTKNPPSHFVKAIHKKTNGNPLFVKECVKHMDEKGIIDANKNIYPKEKDSLEIPSIVQQVVERRINRIEDESKKILDIGSVIGDTVDFEVLSKVVDMNTFDLLDHIDVLVDNDLLEEDPTEEKFYFHHSLIRDAVYQELKNVKKRILHKNIAEAIEDIYSDGLGNHYSKLAHHFKKGKEYEPAYDYYLKKTEKDKEMYAHEDTIETYENILELIDKIPDSKKKKIEVWEGLGETYNIIGEYEKSRKYLRKILDEKVDPKTEIKVYRMISNGFLQQGHFDEAEEVIEKGLSLQNDEDKDSKEYCRLLSNKGWAVMRKGKHDETLEIFKETNEIANRMNDEWLIAQSLHNLGTVYYTIEDYEKSVENLKNAVELWKSCDYKKGLTSSLNNLGLIKLSKGDLDSANEKFKECLDICEKIGDSKGTAIALNNIGDIYREKGKLDKALNFFNKSLEIDKRMEDDEGKANCYNNIGITYYLKGDFERALDYQKESLDIYENIGHKTRIAWVLRSLGDTQRRLGNIETALERYERALELFKETGEKIELSFTFSSKAQTYLKSDKIKKAQKNAEKALDIAVEIGDEQAEGESRIVLGRLHRYKEEFDRAEEELKKGKEMLNGDVEVSKINYELGLLYKEKDDVNKAKELIKESLNLFENMGMIYWQGKCRNQLEDI